MLPFTTNRIFGPGRTRSSNGRFATKCYQRGWEPYRDLYERNGRHEETRTPDLYRVKSRTCQRCRDTAEVQIARMGSVHAGLLTVPCPALVPERHTARPPE